MSARHPTPWRAEGRDNGKRGRQRREFWAVLDRNEFFIAEGLDETTAREIVEAVNDHAKMHEVAANLLRSRDAAIEDGNRLRNLVRDLADALDEAWGHQPPTTDAALLMQARKAIGEGAE